MTDLFAVVAGIDARAITDAIPPAVRRSIDRPPEPRRDGQDVVFDLGPWRPTRPARHLLASLAVLTPHPPSVRFELSGRRGETWSAWVATVALGDGAFVEMPAGSDGVSVDLDEINAMPPLEEVRLRLRVGGRGVDAMLGGRWLATLSAWDGGPVSPVASMPASRLTVAARTQMAEPEDVRLRICSPTSVGMALGYFGREIPTLTLAEQIFHIPTDRYGIWPAAVRTAAAHGVPGYLLRFPDWDTVGWCLARGLPIVASIRYASGELTGSAIPSTTGHLIVITGAEADQILVNDPAASTLEEVPRRYERSELHRVWLERSGVGYVFTPPL